MPYVPVSSNCYIRKGGEGTKRIEVPGKKVLQTTKNWGMVVLGSRGGEIIKGCWGPGPKPQKKLGKSEGRDEKRGK